MGCIASSEGKGSTTKVVVATAEPEKPLPLSVITDGKAREARIRDVFGQLFWYWDKDRDGWLTQADWAANNQSGQASDSAWIEMTRSSARGPNAIDKETFLDFYIQFYLPKDEAEYRMYLDHWGASVTALKRASGRDAEKLHKSSSDAGGGGGGGLGRASNGYQPAATRSSGGSGGVATPGTVPPSAIGNGPAPAASTAPATASGTPTAQASGTPSAAQTVATATTTAATTGTVTASTGLPVASATPAPIAFVMPPI